MKNIILITALAFSLVNCTKKDNVVEETPAPSTTGTNNCPTCTFPDTVWNAGTTSGPRLIFKFKFDSTQVRLDNTGQPSSVAVGNAAYSPKFNGMSAHYIELAQGDLTAFGAGKILYRADETTCANGENAITFCKSVVVKEGDVLFSIPLSQVAGSYKWLRISLAYQNYDIPVRNASVGILNGTVASFLGYNTYIKQYKMKNAVMTPTAGGGVGNHKQGYWGFYTNVLGTPYKVDGQNPANTTTVVNPNLSSPIPVGSCVVTGAFFNQTANAAQPLVITGNETQDIIITVSLSTNKSFEWKEVTADGYYEPGIGEQPVDMGIRGLIPKY